MLQREDGETTASHRHSLRQHTWAHQVAGKRASLYCWAAEEHNIENNWDADTSFIVSFLRVRVHVDRARGLSGKDEAGVE